MSFLYSFVPFYVWPTVFAQFVFSFPKRSPALPPEPWFPKYVHTYNTRTVVCFFGGHKISTRISPPTPSAGSGVPSAACERIQFFNWVSRSERVRSIGFFFCSYVVERLFSRTEKKKRTKTIKYPSEQGRRRSLRGGGEPERRRDGREEEEEEGMKYYCYYVDVPIRP